MEKTSQQKAVFNLIKSVSGQNNLLTVPRMFIDYTGDWTSAILLSQLLFWSDRGDNNDGWIFKTYQEWEDQIAIKKDTLRKAVNKLKKMDILETKVKKAFGNPTVHYRIKEYNFSLSLVAFLDKRKLVIPTNDSSKNQETINNIDYNINIPEDFNNPLIPTKEEEKVKRKPILKSKDKLVQTIDTIKSAEQKKIKEKLRLASLEIKGEEYYHDAKEGACLSKLAKRASLDVVMSKIDILCKKIKGVDPFWQEQPVCPSSVLALWNRLTVTVSKHNIKPFEEV